MEDHKSRLCGARLATVKQLPTIDGYQWLTEAVLRHLIFNSTDRYSSKGKVVPGNGLAPAVLRLGRKVLINLDAFDEWLGSPRQTSPSELI